MDKETLLDWYRQMVLIRRFEQRSAELYQLGKIGGFLHLYIGQEAVAVGTIAAKRDDDHTITAYRDHAHALCVGSDPNAVMAELLSLTPDNIKLTDVQLIMGSVADQKITRNGKILNVEGVITGNSRFFERNVTEYLVRLKKSDLFRNPKVKEKMFLETDGGESLRFVLSLSII